MAEHIPEKCRIKPESGCDDCETTHTKKEPLHTTCAEKIRGRQGPRTGNLTVYCEFKCDDRAKKCWVCNDFNKVLDQLNTVISK